MVTIPRINTAEYPNISSYFESEPSTETLTDAMTRILGVAIEARFDGSYQRFSTTMNKGKSDGWLLSRKYENNLYVASFGTWKDKSKNYTWHSRSLSDSDRFYLATFNAEADRLLKKQYEDKAYEAEKKLESLTERDARQSDYIKSKKLTGKYVDNLPTEKGTIYIPFFRFDENHRPYISTYQTISHDGHKRFKFEAQKAGAWYLFGRFPMPGDTVYMAEGFATAASIFEATGCPTICGADSGNLANVAREWKKNVKGFSCTVIADNDKSKAGENGAKATGFPYMVVPEIIEKTDNFDANDLACNGYDLASWLMSQVLKKKESNVVLEPVEKPVFTDAESLVDDDLTISWLVKNWIQKDGTTFVYGSPNAGKSFFILDLMLSIATEEETFMGQKIKHGYVLYFCGEGAIGMRSRMRAWKQGHGNPNISRLLMAEVPLDFVVDQAYIEAEIKKLGVPIELIVVDTFNRFYSGNENDASEVRLFNQASDSISKKFSCAMIIVHHTGVGEDAQKRVRGSSALRGGANTEILIEKKDNGNGNITFTISQTKQRNAEYAPSIRAKLEDVNLVNRMGQPLLDDDGEPVHSAYMRAFTEEETISMEEKSKSSFEGDYLGIITSILSDPDTRGHESELFLGDIDSNGMQRFFIRSDYARKWIAENSNRLNKERSENGAVSKARMDDEFDKTKYGFIGKLLKSGMIECEEKKQGARSYKIWLTEKSGVLYDQVYEVYKAYQRM